MKCTSGIKPLMTGTFFIFLTLKLLGKIDWSWWWVTAPLWGGMLAGIIILLIVCIVTDRK